MKRVSGLTLVELMITMAIISIGIVAMIGSFRYITTSIQLSKGKTLANNLVAEQIEKLKNLQYYSLLVTTSTYSDNRFTPPLLYDTVNYPYQTQISQGGISFTRATRVDFAYQFGTSITTAPYTSNDTGLKLITVYVIWQDASGLRYQEIHNLMANPAANPLNATLTGTVKDGGGNNISGVMVRTIDNPNYYASSDVTGLYSIRVASGNYTLNASSIGYFSGDKPAYVASGLSTTVNFTLTKMATGTASGYAYINDHLVISQVVAATGTVAWGGGINQDIEYIELYNPTTNAINIGTTAGNATPNIVPVVWDDSNNSYIHRLVYISTYIPVNGYYLISNTGVDGSGNPNTPATACKPFTVASVTVAPDACWQYVLAPNHAIECGTQPCSSPSPNVPDAGGVSLGNATAYSVLPGAATNWPTARIDSIAWAKHNSGNSAPPDATEGTPLSNGGGSLGLQANEQYVRSSLPSGYFPGSGSAYDANSNATDFADNASLTITPHNSSVIQVPVAGTPAAGAYVTSNDLMSAVAQCDSTGHFSIPNISTGNWILAYSTGSYYLEVSNVQMTANLSTSVPNGATSPTWPAANDTNALLNNTTTYAFISGVITDINNVPMPNIEVNAGGNTVITNSVGRYFVSVATGDVLVIANNNNQNKGYASANSTILGTSAGQIYDYSLTDPQCSGLLQCTWFQLSLTGTLVGYFQTSSLTPLPGLTAVAKSGGNQVAQAVSDNSGHFYLASLTTGTYTISPALDPASTVSPTATVVTLSSTGTATNVSTFTVTSGLAQISGQVLVAASTTSITTGVTVLASSVTLSGGSNSMPPTLNGGLGTLCAPCYYGASSDSTGQYTVYVRSSTTPYQLYGWYSTDNGVSFTTVRQGPFALTVSTEGATVTQNISW